MACQPHAQYKECLGAYENEGQCDTCPLALICIEATIAADGYYDEQATERMLLWEEQERMLMDAVIRDAKIL